MGTEDEGRGSRGKGMNRFWDYSYWPTEEENLELNPRVILKNHNTNCLLNFSFFRERNNQKWISIEII